MTGDSLLHTSYRILIPVVLAAMANENGPTLRESLFEILTFQAGTTNSSILRAFLTSPAAISR